MQLHGGALCAIYRGLCSIKLQFNANLMSGGALGLSFSLL
jgi:hypothetical protein